eukprot:m.164083 g.164083  ORF g.164083 m.164083 type:complete len:85 (-) comp14650_c0_seq11:2197-2451(-)
MSFTSRGVNTVYSVHSQHAVQVWVMRGMDLLGKHLSMQNVSLGAALLAGSEELHDAIVKSVSSCEVQTPSGSFLPPYAEANAKP